MYTAQLCQHDMLARKILFKPVLNWLGEALAAFGVTRMVIVPEGANPPHEPEAQTIILYKPVVFSPLLEGGHEHIQWPGGEAVIPWGCLPVSTWEELLEARRVLQAVILHHHMENGVDIADPAGTFIGPDVRIGRGTTLLPGVVIQGAVTIGEGCEIGPYTHIRPDVTLGDETKAGAFVELKNTVWGKGTHAGHLCYVGDTDAGENVNFGCGTVTVNYDGVNKHRAVVGDNAFIGCNTNLVAPVTVGEGAYTAAGSTITHDVPPGALAIARERQVVKENWTSPKTRKNGGRKA